MNQSILSSEQIKLLKDTNIRHSFLELHENVHQYIRKSRKSRRILKRYGFGIDVLWSADYHILILAWLVMKQSSYRNLQGQNPADMITQELIDYPSYTEGYQERIRNFYMTMPQVLTNGELSWFFYHLDSIQVFNRDPLLVPYRSIKSIQFDYWHDINTLEIIFKFESSFDKPIILKIDGRNLAEMEVKPKDVTNYYQMSLTHKTMADILTILESMFIQFSKEFNL